MSGFCDRCNSYRMWSDDCPCKSYWVWSDEWGYDEKDQQRDVWANTPSVAAERWASRHDDEHDLMATDASIIISVRDPDGKIHQFKVSGWLESFYGAELVG